MTNKTTSAIDLVERRFLLMKRGLYYRPDNRGYTGIKANAGRYLESEAHPEAGVTAIHEDDAPLYTEQCFGDVMREHATKVITEQSDTITRLQAALERIAHPEWGHCYTCGTPCFGVTDGCCDNPQWDRDDPEEVASKALRSSVGGE